MPEPLHNSDHDLLIRISTSLIALQKTVDSLAVQIGALPVWQEQSRNSAASQQRQINDLELQQSGLQQRVVALAAEIVKLHAWKTELEDEQATFKRRVGWALTSVGGIVIALTIETLRRFFWP